MKYLLWMVFLLGFWGCAGNDVDQSTERYQQAEEKYQEGHEKRRELLNDPASVLEAFDREVTSLWEEGLKIHEGHRAMRRDLVKVYLQLGEKYDARADSAKESINKIENARQKSSLSTKARADWERAKYYSKLALKHLKILRKGGYRPAEMDIYMGRAYLALHQHGQALAHLRASLEKGDLDPERQKKVKRAIRLVLRLSRKSD